jgi:hypothetical protein
VGRFSPPLLRQGSEVRPVTSVLLAISCVVGPSCQRSGLPAHVERPESVPTDGGEARGGDGRTDVTSLPPLGGNRCALIIGNDTSSASSQGSRGARDMATLLEALGFDVTFLRNADRETILKSVESWHCPDSPDTFAVAYFGGHGFQSEGANYLVPFDMSATDGRLAVKSAVLLDEFMAAMWRMPTAAKMLILDACQTNAFSELFKTKGLARPRKTSPRTLVFFATDPGGFAIDQEGADSPFTRSLLKHIPAPGLPLHELAATVTETVSEYTGTLQTPWTEQRLDADVFSSMFGGVYFSPQVNVAASVDGDDAIVAVLNDQVHAVAPSANLGERSVSLRPGRNILKVLVYNQHTFVGHNSLFGSPEGWRYHLRLRLEQGPVLREMESAEERPAKDGPRHGKTFLAGCLEVNLDPIRRTLRYRASPEVWRTATACPQE